MMPSLLKYFTIVGGLLFAGLIGVNALLEPGGPGLSRVKDTPKVTIRHDPRASLVERLRAEEAAQAAAKQAAEKAQPRMAASAPGVKPEPAAKPLVQAAAPQAPVQTAPAPPPVQIAAAPQPQSEPAPQPIVQAAAQPAPPVTRPAPPAAEPTPVSAPASLNHSATDDDTTHSVRAAQEKKAERAEKARQKRIARERERERSRVRAVREASASRYQDQTYYGYAPRPSYGPFGYPNGGFGSAWGRAW
jgi:hypothetical protein